MLGAVLLTFVLQLAIVYVPQLQPVFNTTPLTLADPLSCIGLSSIVFFGIEAAK